jgi:hypothetical protein
LVFVLLSAVIVSSLLAVEANNQANAAQENANKAKEAADEQAKFAKKFKELAEEQTRLREESDERREKAENLAFQVRFNRFYSQANDNKLLAVVGMAQLLPDAARLKDPHVLESLRLHLAGWAPEAAMNPLRWVGARGSGMPPAACRLARRSSIKMNPLPWPSAPTARPPSRDAAATPGRSCGTSPAASRSARPSSINTPFTWPSAPTARPLSPEAPTTPRGSGTPQPASQ